MKRFFYPLLAILLMALGVAEMHAQGGVVAPISVELVEPLNNTVYDYATVVGTGIPLTTQLYGGYTSSDKGSTIVNGVTFTAVADPVGGRVTWVFFPPTPGIYYITAVFGEYTSAVSRIIVTGVKIKSPVTDVMIPFGSSFVVTGEAFGGDQIVDSVTYKLIPSGVAEDDASVISYTDEHSPYSAIFTPAPSDDSVTTTYRLIATALCKGGNILASNEVAVRVVPRVGEMPYVEFKNPPDGASISAGTTVNLAADANASTSTGYIETVEFYVNGVLLSEDTAIPYTATWTPTIAGTYSLTVLARDDKMNVSKAVNTVTVVGTFPSGEITSPTSGSAAIIRGSVVQVTVRAAGPDGGSTSLSRIDFMVDGKLTGDYLPQNPDNLTPPPALEPPYVFKWTTDLAVGKHRVSALITDSSGFSIETAAVEVEIIENQAPTVSITSPVESSSFPLGQILTINATAGDSDGSVSSVAFYANGSLIATDTSYPYAASYTPTNAGTYVLQAVVTDNLSKSASSSTVSVIVEEPVGLVPLIALSFNDPNVAPGTTNTSSPIPVYSGSNLIINATAIDTDGYISKVEFYANGTLLQTVYEEPYYLVKSFTGMGSLNLVAVVTDNDGNRVESTPIALYIYPLAHPEWYSVELKSPVTGSSYRTGESINFLATHNFGDSANAGVDIYFDGDPFITMAQTTSPYQKSVGVTIPGTWDIRAVARSSGFTAASSAAKVSVVGNSLPTVSFTAPTTGTLITAGTSTKLKVSVADTDGTISKVEYFANGSSLGTSSAYPFTLSWAPSSIGVYKLTAVATDNAGGVTVSSTIAVKSVDSSDQSSVTQVYFSVDSALMNRYAMATVNGSKAYFFGLETNGTARIITDLAIDAAGKPVLANTDVVDAFTCTVGSSALTGTYTVAKKMSAYVCSSTTASTSIPSGVYSGLITGNSSSSVIALVNGDARILCYVNDGTRKELAFGSVLSDGTFSLTTNAKSVIKGSVNMTTSVITATLSNGLSGSIVASKPVVAISGLTDGSLRNISARGQVGSGENVLIAGFVIDGSSSKQVLVRAVGPTLTSMGLTSVTTNPKLALYNSTSQRVAYNDNWTSNPVVSAASRTVGAFALVSESKDAAMVSSLKPGAYTAMVSADSSVVGTSLVEMYDVDSVAAYSSEKIRNISARANVGQADEQKLLAGFVVDGTQPMRVLVRGVGPMLSQYGVSNVLTNPKITLLKRQSDGVTFLTVAENLDWTSSTSSADIETATTKVGAFALKSDKFSDSKSAAILTDIAPGVYTVILSSEDSSTGVAMLEVYEVP